MVVLGIGDCRLEGLLHRAGDTLAGEFKLCKRAVDLLATDHGGNQVQLLRADAERAGYCLRLVVIQPAFGLCLRHGYRSEEHTSELQSLMRISYAVFCLKKKKQNIHTY